MNRKCKKCGHGFNLSGGNRVYCLTCSPFGNNNSCHLHKRQVINGIEHKICTRCKQFRPLTASFYSHHTSGPAGACKDCTNIMNKERQRAIKMRAVEYKGNECQDCHRQFPLCGYDFHHLDPTQKDFDIGKAQHGSWNRLQPELDKCVLLCAVCHRIRHSTDPKLL